MSLFLMDHSVARIMILGRWSSDAFLVYIRPQILEWTNNMSKDMISNESFFDATHKDATASDDPVVRQRLALISSPSLVHWPDHLRVGAFFFTEQSSDCPNTVTFYDISLLLLSVFLLYVYQGSGSGAIRHQISTQTAFGASTILGCESKLGVVREGHSRTFGQTEGTSLLDSSYQVIQATSREAAAIRSPVRGQPRTAASQSPSCERASGKGSFSGEAILRLEYTID
jgi:hypothetical protein